MTYQARLSANLDRWPKDKYLPTLDALLKPASDLRQSVADMRAAFEDMAASGGAIKIRKVA